MKRCLFCAEEIQEDAIKCKHCGEFLDETALEALAARSRPKVKWYFRTSSVVIAVCCVGPLALPLIWWRPQMSWGWKVVLTVGVLLLTVAAYLATQRSIAALMELYSAIEGL